jgi:hypothetical protein
LEVRSNSVYLIPLSENMATLNELLTACFTSLVPFRYQSRLEEMNIKFISWTSVPVTHYDVCHSLHLQVLECPIRFIFYANTDVETQEIIHMGIFLYENKEDLLVGRFVQKPCIGYPSGYKGFNNLKDFLPAAQSLIEMAQKKTLI